MRRLVVVGALAACGRIGFDDGVTPEVADEARASIAVGESASCAIRDGDVYCWGQGEEGQLGATGPAIALRAVRVEGIPKATNIAVAVYHACMVSEAGEVWCWGGNEYGRVGVTPPTMFIAVAGGHRTDPLHVTLPARAIDVSVSNNSTCAVLETGKVSCWGRNHQGQLGNGTLSGDAVNLPGLVIGLDDARRVSLDDDSACALRADGTVVCWGENGRGLIDDSEVSRTVPTPVGLAGASAITLGGDHVCALIDGRVGCRGVNDAGELGDGTTQASLDVVYSSLDDVVAIEAAFHHTCAVRATGTTDCWGDNDFYVLGDGTFEQRHVPATVAGMDDAIAIATGDYSSCAVRASGAVTCWGYGARGQIGDGRSAETRARSVPTLPNVSLVAVGRDHSCVSDTTDVACWGANRYGQLGTGGDLEPTATPQVLPFNWPFGIEQLVAGELFTCAVLANDAVYCWGRNNHGQLGLDNSFADQMTPMRVNLPATASLSAGRDHACALGVDRSVRCWGYNSQGQIGDGSDVTREGPVMITTNVDELALGDEHTCVRVGADVTCWGSNNDGQLGDGTQTAKTAPAAPVPGLIVSGLRAGGSSTCVQRAAGGVACWGSNDSNMLDAPGATYAQLTPAASSQTQLFAMGGRTACSGAMCWGANYVGQVGAGDLGYHGQPTPVVDLPPFMPELALSHSHACAIIDGDTYCWGENASGEIGAGTTSTATFAATTVVFP